MISFTCNDLTGFVKGEGAIASVYDLCVLMEGSIEIIWSWIDIDQGFAYGNWCISFLYCDRTIGEYVEQRFEIYCEL